jgi:hypothetical protein
MALFSKETWDKWLRILVSVLLFLWVVCHLVFCWDARSLESPNKAHFVILVLINCLVLLWAFSNGSLGSKATLSHFILGITPLGLTSLAMVSALPSVDHFLGKPREQVNISHCTNPHSYGEPDRNERPSRAGAETRLRSLSARRALLAVDVSLTVTADQDRRRKICDGLKAIFASDDNAPPVFPEQGKIDSWTFAEGALQWESQDQSPDTYDRGAWLNRVCERLDSVDEGNRSTELVTLLGGLKNRIEYELNEEDDAYVTVVIFSDFLHEVAASSVLSDEAARLTRAAEALRRVSDLNRDHLGRTRFHIVAVRVSGGEPDEGFVDSYGILKEKLYSIWREITLSSMNSSSDERSRKVVSLSALISPIHYYNEDPRCTLHLGQLTGVSGETSIRLKFSREEQSELMGMRLENADRIHQTRQVELGVAALDVDEPRGFNVVSGVLPKWQAERGFPSLMKISSSEDLGQEGVVRLTLRIVLPARAAVYEIPVIITPLAAAEVRLAYTLLVMFFAFSVVALAGLQATHLWPNNWEDIKSRVRS